MPLTRITLHQGKPQHFLNTLSRLLQQTLESHFAVPACDCFQIFEQLAPGQLVYDTHYLGGPRSADFMLLQITAGRPRSALTKRDFYLQLVSQLELQLAVRPQDVMIVISTTQPEDWSFANGQQFISPAAPRA
ncbi:tautomerase family protein [Pantoea sp. B65]|uniref:tautomerase family protein n=1 Tax=Pantoea sp. B65 TaxID=2813359 RepID=UPI0039B6D28B